MKKIISILMVTIICHQLSAQNNELKGRVGIIPIPSLILISVGLGYERMLTPQMSAQIVFNYLVYDISNTDGAGSFIYTNAVPEFRYYLKEKLTRNNPVYIGVFSEVGMRDLDFGMNDDSTQPREINAISKEVSPGLLVGRYGTFNKSRGIYEAFIGAKYIFSATETLWEENGIRNTKLTQSGNWGIRAGVNIIMRFKGK